jgi:hypothetical protein
MAHYKRGIEREMTGWRIERDRAKMTGWRIERDRAKMTGWRIERDRAGDDWMAHREGQSGR